MISVEYSMVLTGVIVSFFMGVIMGALYFTLKRFGVRATDAKRNEKKHGSKHLFLVSFLGNVVDCSFFTFFGVVEIMISYVFLDGAINLYSSLSLIVGFFISGILIKNISMLFHKNGRI